MIDIIQEIFQSLRRNKLRTTLTGLSVSWGIFILIILLGAGNGLKNGVSSNFSDRATNSVTLWSGTTSMPHEGLKSGRNLQFSEKEINAIENQLTESRLVTARISRTQNISNGAEYGSYQIRGVMPDYQNIEHLIINPKDGRFVNQLDINSNNKVIVLDKKIADLLFKKGNAIGKDVKVGDLIFKVIGINSKKEQWGGPNAYIPFSTAQIIFNPSKKFNQITFTVDGLETKEENDKFDEKLRTVMGNMLSFNPKDRQAIWVNNSQADYIETQKIFGGITIFVS
ncbi:MAG: ABC transporter permease, partial [Proteiniphilum sp.]|nr:ABC transporter permease [Proteiniphilum sp.]